MRASLILAILLVLVLFGLQPAASVAGSAIVVTTASDVIADDGMCSLREAVIAANTDAATSGCPAGNGADVITFDAALPAPVHITLQSSNPAPDDDSSLTGDLDFAGVVTLQTSAAVPVVLDGAAQGGVVDVRPGAQVTLSGLELRNAGGPAAGAATVRTTAWLTMTSSTVLDSTGAGLVVQGRLTLEDSRVAGNRTGLEVLGGQAHVTNTSLGSGTSWGLLVNGSGALIMDGGRITAAGGGLANQGGSVTLRAVMIDGNLGPGILNESTLSLMDCVVLNNQSATGGGLVNSGNAALATVARTRFSGNIGAGNGGGIANTGSVDLQASTLDGNESRAGGGIYHNGAVMKLTNVTISGNHAADNGGGIYAQREVTLHYVTLAENLASGPGMGGDLYIDQAQVAVAGSLFAQAVGQVSCATDAGRLTSLGGNIEDGASCGLGSTVPNIVLGPLAFSGGPTPVRALLAGSLAINAGASSYCPASDQRGVPRPQGAACDAGAYEAGVTWSTMRLPLMAR